jgi:hypothetical protein
VLVPVAGEVSVTQVVTKGYHDVRFPLDYLLSGPPGCTTASRDYHGYGAEADSLQKITSIHFQLPLKSD